MIENVQEIESINMLINIGGVEITQKVAYIDPYSKTEELYLLD